MTAILLWFTAENLYNTVMSKKLSMDDFNRLAIACPNLDMRHIEEWRALKAEMERLGIRPRPSTQLRPKKPDSRYIQRISLRHFD